MNLTEIRIKCAKNAEKLLNKLLVDEPELMEEVVKIFNEVRTKCPDQRIGQIFCNYICPDYRCEEQQDTTKTLMSKLFDIKMDPFFEESDDTIKRWRVLSTPGSNPFEEWTHISKIEDWNNFTFARCDTRDFHVKFDKTENDKVDDWFKNRRVKFHKQSIIKLADIPAWLKSLEEYSGGVKKWRCLTFKKIHNWVKYIRFYKLNDTECVVYTVWCGENNRLRVDYMKPEDVIKDVFTPLN